MATTTDLLVRFLSDTSDISGAVRNIEGTGDKIKAWAKGIAISVASAFAVQKIVEFTKEAVQAGSDLEESINKVGVVFGAQSQSILDWSKNSATAMGLSQQAALEAAGTYGNLAVALGLPQDKAADMSKTLVGLAADLASFNNVPIDDAINALRSGLTGEMEPLKKFGVNLNDAALKAQAMAMGLYSGKGNLDASAKAQAAYALILKQTGTAQGDFARTSDGLANQQRISAAQFENFKAQLGEALIPVIQQVISLLNTYLIPAFTALGNILKNNPWIIPLAAAIGTIVVGIKAWAVASKVAEGAVKAWGIAQKAFNIVMLAFNIIMDANPIVLIVIAVVALVAAIVLAYKNVEWFRDLVDTAFSAILDAIQVVWKWVKTNWPLLLAVLTGPFGVAVLLIVKNWDKIKDAVSTVYNWIVDHWPLLLAILTGPVGLAVKFILDHLDGIRTGFDAVVGFFQSIPGRIMDALTALPGLLYDLFTSAVAGIIVGIAYSAIAFFLFWTELVPRVMQAIGDFAVKLAGWAVDAMSALGDFTQKLAGWILDVTGRIASWAVDVITRMLAALVNTAVALWQWWQDLPGKIYGFLQPIPGRLYQFAIDVLTAMGDGLQAGAKAVIDFFTGLPGRAYDAVSSLINRVYTFGMSVLISFGDGLRANASGVLDFFTGLPRRILDALGDTLKILYNAGKNVIQGFIDGAKAALKGVENFFGDVAGKVADWKGPLDYDYTILQPAGVAIMKGFTDSLSAQMPKLRSTLGEVTATVAATGMGGTSAGSSTSTIDARLVINGNVHGIDDLNAWADERDRRLATVLSSGRRP